MRELLDSCATVYSLEAIFRGRADKAARQGDTRPLEEWPRDPRRVAEAKITLLTTDDDLLRSLTRLGAAGRECYRSAISQDDDYDARSRDHKEQLNSFLSSCQTALRTGRVI